MADQTVTLQDMKDSVIRALRRSVEVEEPEVEEDGVELLEQELADLARQALAETCGPDALESMPDFASDDVGDEDGDDAPAKPPAAVAATDEDADDAAS